MSIFLRLFTNSILLLLYSKFLKLKIIWVFKQCVRRILCLLYQFCQLENVSFLFRHRFFWLIEIIGRRLQIIVSGSWFDFPYRTGQFLLFNFWLFSLILEWNLLLLLLLSWDELIINKLLLLLIIEITSTRLLHLFLGMVTLISSKIKAIRSIILTFFHWWRKHLQILQCAVTILKHALIVVEVLLWWLIYLWIEVILIFFII